MTATFVTSIRFRHDVETPEEANAEAQRAVELLREHGYRVFLRSTIPPPNRPDDRQGSRVVAADNDRRRAEKKAAREAEAKREQAFDRWWRRRQKKNKARAARHRADDVAR